MAKRARRKITPEVLADVVDADTEGGIALVVKRFGYTEGYARQLLQRAKKPGTKQPSSNGAVPPKPAPMALTKAIGRVLDDCANAALNGKGVALGALPGFPANTTEPEVLRRAITELEHRAKQAGTSVVELKRRQRVLDLRAALERLERADEGGTDRTLFVAYGGEWADHNGISYAAFREMGVPAELLREAGISR